MAVPKGPHFLPVTHVSNRLEISDGESCVPWLLVNVRRLTEFPPGSDSPVTVAMNSLGASSISVVEPGGSLPLCCVPELEPL